MSLALVILPRNVSIMWFALCTGGVCTVGLISLYCYWHFQKQLSLLTQELQKQQSLTEEVFATIHNTPLQLLAFLMRELQAREVPPEDVFNYLQAIYTELQTVTHRLRED